MLMNCRSYKQLTIIKIHGTDQIQYLDLDFIECYYKDGKSADVDLTFLSRFQLSCKAAPCSSVSRWKKN